LENQQRLGISNVIHPKNEIYPGSDDSRSITEEDDEIPMSMFFDENFIRNCPNLPEPDFNNEYFNYDDERSY